MLVLSWTLLADTEEGMIWAVVGGVIQDLTTGLPTGTSALALVVVAFTANIVLGPVGRGNVIFPPIVIVVGTVLYHLLLIVLLAVLGRGVTFNYALTYITFPTVVFNLVLILPVFRVMGVIFEASRPHRVTL